VSLAREGPVVPIADNFGFPLAAASSDPYKHSEMQENAGTHFPDSRSSGMTYLYYQRGFPGKHVGLQGTNRDT
jgi:hypothetical protein